MEVAGNKNRTTNKINAIDEPLLLTVKAMCKYLSIGQSTARKLLSEPHCPYVIRLGGRVYANKRVLDKWVARNTGR